MHGEPRNPQLPKFSQPEANPLRENEHKLAGKFPTMNESMFLFQYTKLGDFSVSHVSELSGVTIRFNRGFDCYDDDGDDDDDDDDDDDRLFLG